MVELVALYIVCKNIAAVARSGDLKAGPFQARAIFLWLLFELIGGFIAAAIGLHGIFLYLAAFAGALISIHFSYKAVRAAVQNRAPVETTQVDVSAVGFFFLELDNRDPTFNACFESVLFSQASNDLLWIERRLRIKSHFDLFGPDPQRNLGQHGNQDAQVRWIEPDEGIEWLSAVIAHIRLNPLSVKRAAELADDLIRCQGILFQAREIGAKWHFRAAI